MTKSISKNLAITLLATAVGFPLFAESAVANSENAAEVKTEFKCHAVDQDGTTGPASDDRNRSVTAKKGEKELLLCFVKGVSNDDGQAVHLAGFQCGMLGGRATESRQILSPSGNAMLLCRRE